MMNTHAKGAAGLAIVLALAGCSGGGEATTPAATVTVTTTATATTTTTVTATPSSTTKAANASKLGKLYEFEAGFTLQVTDIKQLPQGEHELPLWGAMTKFCAEADNLAASWMPWMLADEDGGQYPPAGTVWGDDPVPQYPNDPERLIASGKCAKGWIFFEVPKGTKVAEVVYSNSVGDHADWPVK